VKINFRSRAISALLLLSVLTLPVQAQRQPVAAPPHLIVAEVTKTNTFQELLAGPAEPSLFPEWIAGMRAYRAEMQALLKQQRNDFPDPYAEPALQWGQRSFIQPQMMAHDRYFYDPVARRYTVRRYLEDLRKRYGGIDSVLIWPTYPNIGVDNRNQFDLWRDMPGGLTGVREMVAQFHRQGVRVLIPIMNWDHGTRDEGTPMHQALVNLATQIGADGFNGDTMSPVGREFYLESLKAKHPLALEPEGGMGKQLEALTWNVLSWGYWWPYQTLPGVDRYKWIEPRHLTHVCDRWAHNRTEMLQHALFNGDGYESWENIWGIWNQVTPRDAEALRRISTIYRAVPDLLVSPHYEPYVPTLQNRIYATRFPGKSATLWTFINRTDANVNGPQIQIPVAPTTRFFDLWRGAGLKPVLRDGLATLAFELEPRGYGALLATDSSPEKPVKKLLSFMRPRANTRLGDLSADWKELPQRIVEIPRTKLLAHAPEGMVRIPAGTFSFESEGVMIEKSEGVDVQYPWEDKPSLKHKHELSLKSFYIDKTPVTCAEFKRFLDATRYKPKDSHNFLRNWVNGSFPTGWAKRPVTWVSLEDARAYAKWAGKRLPHEWEWQYAAQGADARRYPWGNDKDDASVPPFEKGREQRPPTDVDAYPQGASAFGVLDLVGNVWQWTDEFQDEHTRAAILKGGSYYRPDKSMWYFPQARQLNQHGKYLLMAPCLDRSATISFRCVVDAE
jgi:formylglycine-generating enzyme required for sulfatase activity